MGLKGHGTKFDRKMEQAVAALLTQPNIDLAAKSVGISPNTLLNWMKVPEFQTAYRDAKRAAYSQAMARLQQAVPLAVQTMIKLIADPGTPASVRARAADSVVNHANKSIEIEDIAARVTALEEAAGEQGQR